MEPGVPARPCFSAGRSPRPARSSNIVELIGRRANGEEFPLSVSASIWRNGSEIGFALFDLDHFKRINDSHGHATGDDVLRAFGKLVLDQLRAGDVAVRWGGEELLLAFPGGLGTARAVAERVRGRLYEAKANGRNRVEG